MSRIPEEQKSNLRKISDIKRPCLSPEHDPPKYYCYESGIYEYTCPDCGAKTIFTIPISFL